MSFSENLQFIRAQAGVTQERLAEQLNVSRQSVSKWEGGQSFPEMETLLRVCDLYGVNLDLLLRGSVEESWVGDTARYDAFMSRFAMRVSCSVSAIIAGVGIAALAEYGLPELWAGTLFLLILCASVVVLVVSGLQYQNFTQKHPVVADFYTEEQRDAFRQKFVWYIAGGVGAILFGLVLLILSDAWEVNEDWRIAAFLLIAAGAVWAFIYGGIQRGKYNIAKYNRNNNPTPEARRRNQLIGTVRAVVMLLAAAVYVGLGLALDLWRTAWWVLAVGGILCGAAAVVLAPREDK